MGETTLFLTRNFPMIHVNTIFHQLRDILPHNQFERFVGQHKADKYTKRLNCWNQFSILLYAQAKRKESLRDIETGLNAHTKKLYHLGIESCARSTLADANTKRPYQIYEALFYEVLKIFRTLTPQSPFNLDYPVKAFDSTTITFCLKLFPWAKFKETKGAVKMHTLFDIGDQIPEFITDSSGLENDLKIAKKADFPVFSDSIYVFDRAYIDSKWLYENFHQKNAFFVLRLKKNMKYFVQESFPALENGVLADEHIMFTGEDCLENYPEDVRLVTYLDKNTGKIYRFFTNNFDLSAKEVADIYRMRWDIEKFFRWIKQNLKIKTFLGTSKNAVLTQIWIAMIYYLLVTYIKKQTKFSGSMLTLTRILEETFMERAHLIDILSLRPGQAYRLRIRDHPQLSLC